MKQTKRKSDKQIVDEQLRSIACNYYNDKFINTCNPLFKNDLLYGKACIIKNGEYEKTYLESLNNNNYFLLLKDQSMINLFYTFDKDENILEHTLIYMPPPNSKTYIRFDFKEKAIITKRGIVEPSSHLHNSILDDDYRIPVDKIVMPYDFVYFILKYFYMDNSNFLNSMKVGLGKIIACSKYKIYLKID